MFKNWFGRWKQKRDGKKIAKGKLPRGRTDMGIMSGDFGQAILEGKTRLEVRHFRPDGTEVEESRRVVWNRVVTTAGVTAIAQAFTNGFELENFNYHDCGTGTTAEAIGQTALVTPVSEARVAGVQSNPSAGVYRSVGSFTFSNPYAITEHGLFSQSAKPGGTLLDRTLFAAINVANGDKIDFTFDITFAAGG